MRGESAGFGPGFAVSFQYETAQRYSHFRVLAYWDAYSGGENRAVRSVLY